MKGKRIVSEFCPKCGGRMLVRNTFMTIVRRPKNSPHAGRFVRRRYRQCEDCQFRSAPTIEVMVDYVEC